MIYEGDNDTGRYRVPPAAIAGRLEAIVERIHAALPSTRVYVMSVKPSLARVAVWDKAQETNALYGRLADDNDLVSYIDVATPFLRADGKVMDDIFIEDGLHLNEKGTRNLGLDHQGGADGRRGAARDDRPVSLPGAVIPVSGNHRPAHVRPCPRAGSRPGAREPARRVAWDLTSRAGASLMVL